MLQFVCMPAVFYVIFIFKPATPHYDFHKQKSENDKKYI